MHAYDEVDALQGPNWRNEIQQPNCISVLNQHAVKKRVTSSSNAPLLSCNCCVFTTGVTGCVDDTIRVNAYMLAC